MKKDLIPALAELLSRLTIGIVFAESGWAKLHSLAKVTAYFESLGIPMAQLQAPFASVVELVAGLLILLGLFTRFASLPLIVIMLVAIRTAKWEDVTDFSSLLGLSEFLYIVILLWLVAYGGKFVSVDQWIANEKRRRRTDSEAAARR